MVNTVGKLDVLFSPILDRTSSPNVLTDIVILGSLLDRSTSGEASGFSSSLADMLSTSYQ